MGVPDKMFCNATMNGNPVLPDASGGTGGSFIGNLLSGFGALKSGSPQDAPTDFIPGAGGGAGGGSIVDFAAGLVPGQQGKGGNVNDNSFNAQIIASGANAHDVVGLVKAGEGEHARRLARSTG